MNTAKTSLNRTIDLADFKTRCLEVLDQLGSAGLIVTKEGRPLAKITPLTAVNNQPLIGSMKEEIAIHGDVFSTGQDEAAFKWINAHGNEYQGQWLALDGDRLLAHGVDLAEVAASARAAGVQFPLLHLVEPERKYPYTRSTSSPRTTPEFNRR